MAASISVQLTEFVTRMCATSSCSAIGTRTHDVLWFRIRYIRYHSKIDDTVIPMKVAAVAVAIALIDSVEERQAAVKKMNATRRRAAI